MAFTNIPNGNLQVGAPLRSVDILALRDNIPAVMNGETGAPKIKAAAFEGQSGPAPVFAARAWVNFNGTNGSIRGSGNVSVVTRHATGEYTAFFATAMTDTNYSITSMAGDTTAGFSSITPIIGINGSINTASLRFRVVLTNSTQQTVHDAPFVFLSVFR